ncbi:MAG TPA: HAMP domain-containing sensor histidine kinase [Candidatus Krumholzibacteria bacterium]
MKRDRNNEAAGRRVQTDASLGSERAGMGATVDRVQRQLADLIARDRILSDERLSRVRESADELLTAERAASPRGSSQLQQERRAADESKYAERYATDGEIAKERQHDDAHEETGRLERALDLAKHEAQRKDTNDCLSAERHDADLTTAALQATRSALDGAHEHEARSNEIFSMVTHDLRNPLCVIVANANLIADGVTDPVMRDAAQDVRLAAARMGRLLTDLLNVARIDAGMLRMEKRRHDVRALLSEVLHSYRSLFDGRGVHFAVDVPTTEMFASFDYDRASQLLSNLLGNAMKFTTTGGSVALHAERQTEQLVFVVQDTGSGIDPDALPHLFERFFQRDSNNRRGLGLGLYICRTIAEAHGGTVSVESKLGEGSTFRVSLQTS